MPSWGHRRSLRSPDRLAGLPAGARPSVGCGTVDYEGNRATSGRITHSEFDRAGKEIHVIADNLSAHKTGQVKEFQETHPKVHLHFTPTYSSWLNQVELWFSKIERDVIARGVFTSVSDLKRKLMRYIREYNRAPKTVKWKYFDPKHRITPASAVTAH